MTRAARDGRRKERSVVARLAVTAMAVAAGGFLAGCANESVPDRPNVVLFLVDTLRADRLGVYGSGRETSPAIDALAEQSVVFDAAYAPAPWTLPSVVSMMTSTFVCEHGVTVDGQAVSPSLTTLAERLRGLGYRTAAFVANPYAGPMSGLDRGFEVHERTKFTDGERVSEWLAGGNGRPFFLFVHNTEPHDPYAPPAALLERLGVRVGEEAQTRITDLLKRHRELTRVDYQAGRPRGTTDVSAELAAVRAELAARHAEARDLYDGDVRLADERVASVLEALKTHGSWDDTLFVFVSDHGEEFGEHGGWQHDQSVYEELARVPLIVRFPGDAHAGRRIGAVASLVDLVPTVLEVVGGSEPDEAPRSFRGRSLLPVIEAATEPSGDTTIPAMRWNVKKFLPEAGPRRGDVNIAVRDGRWKAVWNAESETTELFDLRADPAESTDLSAAESERAAALRDAARDWLTACRAAAAAAPPVTSGDLDEKTLERLRALGYLP